MLKRMWDRPAQIVQELVGEERPGLGQDLSGDEPQFPEQVRIPARDHVHEDVGQQQLADDAGHACVPSVIFAVVSAIISVNCPASAGPTPASSCLKKA